MTTADRVSPVPTQILAPSTRWPRPVAAAASGLVVVLGVIFLASWFFDVPVIKSLHPALVSMKANTALCFVLAGVSLWLLRKERSIQRMRFIVWFCAAAVTLTGLLTLMEYAFGWDLGLDQLLFREEPGTAFTSHPGRMAPATALDFVLLGTALLVLTTRRAPAVAQWLAIAAGGVAALALADCVCDFRLFSAIGSYTSIAVHTTVTLMLLSAGVLCARPDAGVMAWARPAMANIGFGFAMAALLVVALGTSRNVHTLLETNQNLQHTHAVKESVVRVLSGIQDVETGTRGFVITGRNDFLEPYRDATARLREELKGLRSLTANNPDQQRRLDVLEPLALQKLGFSSEQAALRRDQGFEAAVARVDTGTGQRLMDDIRKLVDEIHHTEDRLLQEQRAAAEASTTNAILAMSIGGLASLSILTVVFYVLRHENSERKLAEERIQRLNEALTERATELEAANQELESFSYSVSHDLRAPLRGIDGFSQALMEDCADKLGEASNEHLRRIRAATQRMGQLIDDLLDLARVTRQKMRREAVDLTALARVVTSELQGSHPDRKVEWVIADNLSASGDPHLLRVALQNLLSNAWKFTGKQGTAQIEFGGRYEEQKPVYFVRDNGVGFDTTYADKLFAPFQRLHPASEFPGTGIGLATVQRIIRRHGGRVWAEGKVGQGAVFSFTL